MHTFLVHTPISLIVTCMLKAPSQICMLAFHSWKFTNTNNSHLTPCTMMHDRLVFIRFTTYKVLLNYESFHICMQTISQWNSIGNYQDTELNVTQFPEWITFTPYSQSCTVILIDSHIHKHSLSFNFLNLREYLPLNWILFQYNKLDALV